MVRHKLSVVAIGFLLLSFGLLLIALSLPSNKPDPSTVIPKSVGTSVPKVASSPQQVALGSSPAVRIEIPAIGVDAPVETVGTVGTTVATPPLEDHNLAGWYDGSSSPGQAGPSLIVGHVDSYTGPSVFYRLKDLVVGDRVSVLRADGKWVTYQVAGTQAVAKSDFPWSAVLGSTSSSTLRLVTCGGAFNYSTDRYVDNIIVYANLR